MPLRSACRGQLHPNGRGLRPHRPWIVAYATWRVAVEDQGGDESLEILFPTSLRRRHKGRWALPRVETLGPPRPVEVWLAPK